MSSPAETAAERLARVLDENVRGLAFPSGLDPIAETRVRNAAAGVGHGGGGALLLSRMHASRAQSCRDADLRTRHEELAARYLDQANSLLEKARHLTRQMGDERDANGVFRRVLDARRLITQAIGDDPTHEIHRALIISVWNAGFRPSASILLDDLLETITTGHYSTIALLALQSHVRKSNGDTAGAREALRAAISLAQVSSYPRNEIAVFCSRLLAISDDTERDLELLAVALSRALDSPEAITLFGAA